MVSAFLWLFILLVFSKGVNELEEVTQERLGCQWCEEESSVLMSEEDCEMCDEDPSDGMKYALMALAGFHALFAFCWVHDCERYGGIRPCNAFCIVIDSLKDAAMLVMCCVFSIILNNEEATDSAQLCMLVSFLGLFFFALLSTVFCYCLKKGGMVCMTPNEPCCKIRIC